MSERIIPGLGYVLDLNESVIPGIGYAEGTADAAAKTGSGNKKLCPLSIQDLPFLH